MSTSGEQKQAQEKIKLRLHYWDCRGRVQTIRYMLEDIAAKHSNVEYKDDYELMEKAMEQWANHKADNNISGPFGNLPVLHWDETHVIGQTLPIGQLLARKFDLYGKPKSANEDPILFQALIDGVVSCAYTDIIINVFLLLWSCSDLNDTNDPQYRIVKKITGDLKKLNNLLETSSTPFFYDQDTPTIADYFVFEAFTLARYLYSALVPTENDSQSLIKLEKTMKTQPGLARYFNENRLFKRITGSPTEAQYLAKLAGENKMIFFNPSN